MPARKLNSTGTFKEKPTEHSDQTPELMKQFKVIRRLAQNSSERVLEFLGQAGEFKINPLEYKDRFVFGAKMAMTPILTPEFRMLFKVHYNSSALNLLDANKRKVDVSDFIHEFCNQTAGEIRKVIERVGQSGAGVPVITHAFDELVYRKFKSPNQDFYYWEFQRNDSKLVCSTTIDIMDGKSLAEKIDQLDHEIDQPGHDSIEDQIELF